MHDSLPGVRLALATACLDLAPQLGQAAFMQHLMPVLEMLLMDRNALDNVKVRVHILSRLAVIGPWLSSSPSSSSTSSSTGTSSTPPPSPSILPILLDLRDDDNWRLRKAAIEALPVLAEHMPSADHTLLFEPALLPHLLSAFQDRVSQVRMAATGALNHLARVAGPEFIRSKVFPRMKELYHDAAFYLVRSAVLQATKVLARLSPLVDPSSLRSSIQPCLQNLVASDPDSDVRFYAALALEQKEEASLAAAAAIPGGAAASAVAAGGGGLGLRGTS
eukprot:evm.model.NODE_23176_length_15026_cov_24.516239.1